jgi:hypothetical protein
MQIGRGIGPVEWGIAVVGAAYVAFVVVKALGWLRDELRRRRDAPPPPPGPEPAAHGEDDRPSS